MAARKASTKKATPKAKKTGKRGRPPGTSPVNGSTPPKEHRFSSTNQPRPERRSGPVVNVHTIGEAIRRASKAKVAGRYSSRFLAKVRTTFGLEDEDLQRMTVAELVAAVAEAGAVSGDFRFWDRFVERNEGKVPMRTELTGADGEPLKIEDGRAKLGEVLARHAATSKDDEDEEGDGEPPS